MPREIRKGLDVLFVEGPDDGAVVNALVKKMVGVDLVASRLVRTNEGGAGDAWALREFDKYVAERRSGDVRVGVIVDRDRVENDTWPAIRARLRTLGMQIEQPIAQGAIVDGRFGVWMWPDNIAFGSLEDFVAGIVPASPLLTYATEACAVAKKVHGAEYDAKHSRKAALKTRSVWRDARAAGGYGHLVRNLALVETPASAAFLAWLTALFLT